MSTPTATPAAVARFTTDRHASVPIAERLVATYPAHGDSHDRTALDIRETLRARGLNARFIPQAGVPHPTVICFAGTRDVPDAVADQLETEVAVWPDVTWVSCRRELGAQRERLVARTDGTFERIEETLVTVERTAESCR